MLSVRRVAPASGNHDESAYVLLLTCLTNRNSVKILAGPSFYPASATTLPALAKGCGVGTMRPLFISHSGSILEKQRENTKLVGTWQKEVRSESFQTGLKPLLDKHPELRSYVMVARRWTELIETYGDAVMAKSEVAV